MREPRNKGTTAPESWQISHDMGEAHSRNSFLLCNRNNEATGKSPVELLYGAGLAHPGEFACCVTDSNTDAADSEVRDGERMHCHHKACENQKRYVQKWLPETKRPPMPLLTSDYVYVCAYYLSTAKQNFCVGLAPKWTGPYRILERISQTSYRVQIGPRRQCMVHRDDICTPSNPDDIDDPHPPDNQVMTSDTILRQSPLNFHGFQAATPPTAVPDTVITQWSAAQDISDVVIPCAKQQRAATDTKGRREQLFHHLYLFVGIPPPNSLTTTPQVNPPTPPLQAPSSHQPGLRRANSFCQHAPTCRPYNVGTCSSSGRPTSLMPSVTALTVYKLALQEVAASYQWSPLEKGGAFDIALTVQLRRQPTAVLLIHQALIAVCLVKGSSSSFMQEWFIEPGHDLPDPLFLENRRSAVISFGATRHLLRYCLRNHPSVFLISFHVMEGARTGVWNMGMVCLWRFVWALHTLADVRSAASHLGSRVTVVPLPNRGEYLHEIGTFKTRGGSGHPRDVVTPNVEEEVLNAMEENPSTSTRTQNGCVPFHCMAYYVRAATARLQHFLEDVMLVVRQCMWLQPSGAPPHSPRAVHEHFNMEFQAQWIRKGGPWGFIKGLVYETPIESEEDLFARYMVACDKVHLGSPSPHELHTFAFRLVFSGCSQLNFRPYQKCALPTQAFCVEGETLFQGSLKASGQTEHAVTRRMHVLPPDIMIRRKFSSGFTYAINTNSDDVHTITWLWKGLVYSQVSFHLAYPGGDSKSHALAFPLARC
ncbi:hypothetical protein PR048_011384 [Dryococelus australis]|uniref:Uncharacterized protein n=1 Tax=Dryococelus australis TaxID=614101 RepID=A0ABQ9HMQ5_9NEOP|nr:hypothetical protein PR048_011384 [Dryococelus australis]